MFLMAELKISPGRERCNIRQNSHYLQEQNNVFNGLISQ